MDTPLQENAKAFGLVMIEKDLTAAGSYILGRNTDPWFLKAFVDARAWARDPDLSNYRGSTFGHPDELKTQLTALLNANPGMKKLYEGKQLPSVMKLLEPERYKKLSQIDMQQYRTDLGKVDRKHLAPPKPPGGLIPTVAEGRPLPLAPSKTHLAATRAKNGALWAVASLLESVRKPAKRSGPTYHGSPGLTGVNVQSQPLIGTPTTGKSAGAAPTR